MAELDKRPVTLEELLVSSLAQTDALAKLLIEKGLITREEFMQKIAEERATYQKLLKRIMAGRLRVSPLSASFLLFVRAGFSYRTVTRHKSFASFSTYKDTRD
jgi:hypothetical protein